MYGCGFSQSSSGLLFRPVLHQALYEIAKIMFVFWESNVQYITKNDQELLAFTSNAYSSAQIA